jgi:Sel1 repeat
MYRDGRGVPQNDATAMSWFRKGADQGDAAGQSELALMYASGRGVARDYVAAMSWSRKAADQGWVFLRGGSITRRTRNGEIDRGSRHPRWEMGNFGSYVFMAEDLLKWSERRRELDVNALAGAFLNRQAA